MVWNWIINTNLISSANIYFTKKTLISKSDYANISDIEFNNF